MARELGEQRKRGWYGVNVAKNEARPEAEGEHGARRRRWKHAGASSKSVAFGNKVSIARFEITGQRLRMQSAFDVEF